MTPADERRIAENATPGEWVAFGTDVGHFTGKCTCGPMGNPGHERFCGIEGPIAQAGEEDAEFIATFNPARVLELLDENGRLSQRVTRLSYHARRNAGQRDEARARLAAVEELHYVGYAADTRVCIECYTLYPCDTIKAVRGE